MKPFVALGGSGMLLGGLYAGGVLSPAGEVYNIPIAEARAELVGMPLPPDVLHSVGTSGSGNVVVRSGPESVRWQIMAGGHPAGLYVAELQAENPWQTRVSVRGSATSTDTFASRITSSKFMRDYSDAAFAEQVDASLEGRAADPGDAMRAFAGHLQSHPEDVQELGLAVQGIFTEVAKQASANMHDSVGGSGGYSPESVERSMDAATRPTVVLPTQR